MTITKRRVYKLQIVELIEEKGKSFYIPAAGEYRIVIEECTINGKIVSKKNERLVRLSKQQIQAILDILGNH